MMKLAILDNMDQQHLIAEIVGVHGVKGLVKLRLHIADLTVFQMPVLINNSEHTLTLKNKVKSLYLAQIEGIDNRDQAELLKNSKIYTNTLSEDSHLHLITMRCIDQNNTEQGVVISIENFGASDLLEIKPKKGASFFLPLVAPFVQHIDKENKTITIDMPEVI